MGATSNAKSMITMCRSFNNPPPIALIRTIPYQGTHYPNWCQNIFKYIKYIPPRLKNCSNATNLNPTNKLMNVPSNRIPIMTTTLSITPSTWQHRKPRRSNQSRPSKMLHKKTHAQAYHKPCPLNQDYPWKLKRHSIRCSNQKCITKNIT